MAAARSVLHFAAHPDDELLGAPATLMALRDAGWRVVNVACSLGRPDDEGRRRQELEQATERAGFALVVPERPARMSATDDLAAARADLRRIAATALTDIRPDVVVSPGPHDRHHGHELVARAVGDALRDEGDRGPRWWLTGLWASLPMPTIGTVFDEARLTEIIFALEAHAGELERIDYRKALRGRGEMNSALGPELLFGFGSKSDAGPYVELLSEAVLMRGRWLLGRAHWLDVGAYAVEPSDVELTAWLDAPSVSDMFGPPASQNREDPAPRSARVTDVVDTCS